MKYFAVVFGVLVALGAAQAAVSPLRRQQLRNLARLLERGDPSGFSGCDEQCMEKIMNDYDSLYGNCEDNKYENSGPVYSVICPLVIEIWVAVETCPSAVDNMKETLYEHKDAVSCFLDGKFEGECNIYENAHLAVDEINKEKEEILDEVLTYCSPEEWAMYAFIAVYERCWNPDVKETMPYKYICPLMYTMVFEYEQCYSDSAKNDMHQLIYEYAEYAECLIFDNFDGHCVYLYDEGIMKYVEEEANKILHVFVEDCKVDGKCKKDATNDIGTFLKKCDEGEYDEDFDIYCNFAEDMMKKYDECGNDDGKDHMESVFCGYSPYVKCLLDPNSKDERCDMLGKESKESMDVEKEEVLKEYDNYCSVDYDRTLKSLLRSLLRS